MTSVSTRGYARPREGYVIAVDGKYYLPEVARQIEEAESVAQNERLAEGITTSESEGDLVSAQADLDASPSRVDPPEDGVEDGVEDDIANNPIIPPGNGRASTGAEPQTQMDEIILDVAEHRELLLHLGTMERFHEFKLEYDKAHRVAWDMLKTLGKGDGRARAYRLQEYRIAWPDAEGDSKLIQFTRQPMQKVTVTHTSA